MNPITGFLIVLSISVVYIIYSLLINHSHGNIRFIDTLATAGITGILSACIFGVTLFSAWWAIALCAVFGIAAAVILAMIASD